MVSRRSILLASIPVLACPALLWAPGALAAPAQQPRPSEMPPPEGIPGRSRRDEPPAPDPRVLLKEHQKEIRESTQKLYDLATELKREVDKTDSTDLLSMTLIKKAEQVEKLAKKIQSLARG